MKTKLFFVFLIAGALAACTQSAKTSETKVKKTFSFLRKDTSEMTYSPEGKIITRTSFGGMVKQTFVYEETRVIEEGISPPNGQPFTVIYFINKNGLMDSSMRISTTDTIYLSYKYDNAGFRVEEYIGSRTKSLAKQRIVEGGNVTREILFSDGKEMQYIHFGYYADKPNKSTVFNEELLGYPYKGKDSKNLLKQMVLISPAKDTLFDNSFSYHFDEDDRVSLVAIYTNTGQLIDSSSYFY